MKLKTHNPFSFLLVSALLFACSATIWAQTKDRLVQWPPRPMGKLESASEGTKMSSVSEALEIVSLSIRGRPITIDKPFPADDDWLRGLTFKIKNISGQPIVGMRLYISFADSKYKEGFIGMSFEYGKGLSTGIPSDEQRTVLPGEDFELQFNDRQYERHKRFVSERSGGRSFSNVWIGWAQVKFLDESVWTNGCLPASDPRNACNPNFPERARPSN
jgi:hypothetical protein